MIQITVLVDNDAKPPFRAEHGLALSIASDSGTILFDTGAGGTLLPNLAILGISQEEFSCIVLSHGHNDHTGGLANLSPRDLFFAPGIDRKRFSLHPEMPVHDISMPEDSRRAMAQFRKFEISHFTEIKKGIFLTGPIPRLSSEDSGGPFFLDREGTTPDTISDEQALLFREGVLIQGCCHAGIINTLEYCRQQAPEIHIHTIVGGLHLAHASQERLILTLEALRSRGIKTLIPLHCTGSATVSYLKKNLPFCTILSASPVVCA